MDASMVSSFMGSRFRYLSGGRQRQGISSSIRDAG